jgi:hypothetical protein
MPAANIALIIDRSASMSDADKLPAAQTDTSTFVNIMQVNDQLSVSAFSDNAGSVYPSTASLATISGQSTQDAAVQAIAGLSTINATNIAAALLLAHGILASAATPKAMVLLSDGYWNTGGNPLTHLNTDIPIYAIALGGDFNPTFMQTLAERTRGRYYYAPDAASLAEIYNDVINDSDVAQTLQNQRSQIPQYSYSTISATVDPGSDKADFAVQWIETQVAYTPGTPVGNQLTARLIDPNRAPTGLAASTSGSGFAVFRVPNPLAGQWTIETWSAAPVTLHATSSAFAPDSPVSLDVELPAASEVGAGLDYRASLTENGAPIADAQVLATLEGPLRSAEESAASHADRLAQVEPDAAAIADGLDEQRARFASLVAQDPSVHPRRQRVVQPPVATHDDGALHGRIRDTDVPGGYTLRLRAQGTSPSTGAPVERVRCLSFHVAEPSAAAVRAETM